MEGKINKYLYFSIVGLIPVSDITDNLITIVSSTRYGRSLTSNALSKVFHSWQRRCSVAVQVVPRAHPVESFLSVPEALP
jgi:hypothetical protein